MDASLESIAPLVEIKDLDIRFRDRERVNHAVKGVSFDIPPGHTMAVVGESGSGKSVTAMALTRLLPPRPQCEIRGEVRFEGESILSMRNRRLREIRGKDIAYIFQEPSSSLNPYLSIGSQIEEALRLHRPEVEDRREAVIAALELVGIRNPERRYRDYPHQMSGGMKQRVMIAMALACRPKLLVADEPTTALDVTIQAQILELMGSLKDQLKMSILLITHNFGIVDGFADDLVVLFRGEIVEQGPTEAVLRNPQHPYTKALIDCIPRIGASTERLAEIDHESLLRATGQKREGGTGG